MGLWDDAAATILATGAARRLGPRRRPRREEPIDPSVWLAVGVGAVAAQIGLLLTGLGFLAYWAWVMCTDELLFILGLIVAPVVLSGLGMGCSLAWWMGSVARRLLAWDGSARLHLGVLATGGTFAGSWLVMLRLTWPGLLVLAASLTASVVVVMPAVWRPSSTR